MPSLLASLLSFILLYKYAALFLITFLSALAVPLPSGAIIVAAFVFAGQGYMNTAGVVATATVGNILGDVVGFALARRYGREFMERIGLKRILHAPFIERLERRVAKHPFVAVFLTRLTTSITPAANLLAGFAKVGWPSFIIADIIGQGAETALNFFYGRVFGETWTFVGPITEKLGYIVIAVAALIVILLWRRRSRAHALLADHRA